MVYVWHDYYFVLYILLFYVYISRLFQYTVVRALYSDTLVEIDRKIPNIT